VFMLSENWTYASSCNRPDFKTTPWLVSSTSLGESSPATWVNFQSTKGVSLKSVNTESLHETGCVGYSVRYESQTVAPMRRWDQLLRQWRILRHLREHSGGASVVEIGNYLNTPVRSIYRDVETLLQVGFPIDRVWYGRHAWLKWNRQGGVIHPVDATPPQAANSSRVSESRVGRST
jgi:hypothetical protein